MTVREPAYQRKGMLLKLVSKKGRTSDTILHTIISLAPVSLGVVLGLVAGRVVPSMFVVVASIFS